MTLFQTISSLFRREEGQGLAEYALILALIAIVAIVALLFLGTQISTILSTIGNALARGNPDRRHRFHVRSAPPSSPLAVLVLSYGGRARDRC